jgi:hypothetical protein
VKTTESKAAADARISVELALRKRGELLDGLRPYFARVTVWQQAGKYLGAVTSELPKRNGWSIACRAGDRTPDRTQRLLNRAVWDTFAVMGQVRKFAVAGLDEAARKAGRRRGQLVIGALDETGQQKKGQATAGVKRQHMGCAGGVANGINTVHLAYVREKTGHALIGARQWIPAEHIDDAGTRRRMGLPAGLRFRTKGQLAIDIFVDLQAEGIKCDFYCGDEVGRCNTITVATADGGTDRRPLSSYKSANISSGNSPSHSQMQHRISRRLRKSLVAETSHIVKQIHLPISMPHRHPTPLDREPQPCDSRSPGQASAAPTRRERHQPPRLAVLVKADQAFTWPVTASAARSA